jgi:hypothetical protein
MMSIPTTTVTRTLAAALLWPSLAALSLSASARPPLGTPDDDAAANSAPWTAPVQAPAADAAIAPTIPRVASETDEAPQEPSEPLTECPPTEPHRIGADLCMSQEALDRINDGWQARVDPATGQVTWTPPPSYDPVTGQWGHFSAATQACDPQIEVQLKQAALAGSQLTRAISDRQLAYAQTDPIEAVNNPRKDGAGGVCTIDLFAVDLGRLLGSTDEQIKNLIDTLSHLSMDGLFGAACQVVNTVFGDLQNELLQEVQNSAPLTGFQQFVKALRVGYIAPLQSFLGYGLTVRPTVATIPGIVTAHPLQVSYVPGQGYLYLADFGSGNQLVLHISSTPLAPGDAVAPTPP